MKRYLDYAHALAYTDGLTGVGNTTAYLERVKALDADDAAAYCVAVFDIDLLKQVNDNYGHACGDMIIRGAAGVISRVFGKEHVYRIGGDEFLVITGEMEDSALAEQLAHVEAAAANFSLPDKTLDCRLSLSSGAAVHRAGDPGRLRDAFILADGAMYRSKGEHHRRSRE